MAVPTWILELPDRWPWVRRLPDGARASIAKGLELVYWSGFFNGAVTAGLLLLVLAFGFLYLRGSDRK